MKERSASTAALGAVIVLAAVLRLVDLGAKSVWSDEAFSIFLAKLSWPGFWHIITTTEANMSLYYLLLRVWIGFGDAAWRVRLLSALMGVAAVPVTYWIGREIFSQRAGILAALLLAINPFQIRYAQEARSYSLLILLVSLSFLSFFCSLKHPTRFWSICYVVSTTLALYAHLFAAFAVLVQLVSVAALPSARRQFAIRQAVQLCIVVVLGLPLLWFVLFRDRGQLDWAPAVHVRDLYHVFLFMTGSGLKFAIALLAFFIAARSWVMRCRNQRWTIEAWSVLVLMFWLFLPVSLTLLVSVWKPVYAPRFLIFCLPSALLLVAEGLTEISYAWVRYALVTLLVLSTVAPIRSYYAETGQEDWKSVVEFLARAVAPGDRAYVPNAYCQLPLHYGLQHARIEVPSFPIISSIPPDAQVGGNSGDLWMIGCSASRDLNERSEIGNYEIQQVREFKGVWVTELSRARQP